MRRSTPYQLTAFSHVVREGSVTAAAQKLGVSQSAVTQHLQKLEALVGAKLIARSRDGQTLTRTGQEIFELAERHVSLERVIAERLAGYAELDNGHLTIIANAPAPALSLIARFNRKWPNIQIDFTLYDWTTAIEMLRTHQVDIALIFEPTHSPDWKIYDIGRERYVLYAPAKHPFAKRKIISLGDLAGQTLLLPEQGSLTQRVVSKALTKHDLNVQRKIKTTTFPVMKEAILQGAGVGIFLENSTVETDALCSLPIHEMPETYRSCVVVPKDKHDLRLVQRFLSLVGSGNWKGHE
ncbi:LysR family transcriptional regulator [Pacificibacter marinus]|uniref:HTH-type transcriptional regulator CysL n=1 Tax=Pacificibacter marinus TaxID=658057 RepID=A0A1Y5REI7_9RHOB|nr:LysR family transcriptional regulator [Pacificibacter marinus]SEK23489.1 transcriptional regulator, LysR family [Pacificibacter marinus]SLN14418.1 HTH-type transcriptional regulator CysL [Pacificibacter marinus]